MLAITRTVVVVAAFSQTVHAKASSGGWAKCTTGPDLSAHSPLGCASHSATEAKQDISVDGWAKCTTGPDLSAHSPLGCASHSATNMSTGAWTKCTAGTEVAAHSLLGRVAELRQETKQVLNWGVGDSKQLVEDLVTNSQLHLAFLKAVHGWAGDLLYKPSATLACAVKRYNTNWIPLMKAMSTKNAGHSIAQVVVPPVDVAWVWHVHRLASLEYASFAQRHGLYTTSLDGAFQLQKSAGSHTDPDNATRVMWEQMFGNQSFFIDPANLPADCPSTDVFESTTADTPSSLSFRFFAGAADRQGRFLWNYLLPNFENPAFLRESAERYVRFIHLVGHNPNEPLVPSHPVDLMWHTHILASHAQYDRDVRRMNGPLAVIGHNDNAPAVELKEGFVRTFALWAEAYGSSRFSKFLIGDDTRGGMTRGAPPAAHWKGLMGPDLAPRRPRQPQRPRRASDAGWAKCTTGPDMSAHSPLGCASHSATDAKPDISVNGWAKCTTGPDMSAHSPLGCASHSATDAKPDISVDGWAKCTTGPDMSAHSPLGCASHSATDARPDISVNVSTELLDDQCVLCKGLSNQHSLLISSWQGLRSM